MNVCFFFTLSFFPLFSLFGGEALASWFSFVSLVLLTFVYFPVGCWVGLTLAALMMYACVSVCLIVTLSALLTTQLDACIYVFIAWTVSILALPILEDLPSVPEDGPFPGPGLFFSLSPPVLSRRAMSINDAKLNNA